MIQIDPQTIQKYKMALINSHISETDAHLFLKWLRYYLDFCHKVEYIGKASSVDTPMSP